LLISQFEEGGSIMSRRIGLYCVAVATALLTFATADDAQARGRRNGSCGSNGGYGSNGSFGSNGGSFGGFFRRNGSHGSNGGYGSRGGNGSCGSHGGYHNGHRNGDVHYGEAPEAPDEAGVRIERRGEVRVGDRGVREEREARYRGERAEGTFDTRRQPMPAPQDRPRIEAEAEDRPADEGREAAREPADQSQAEQDQAEQAQPGQEQPQLSPPQQSEQGQEQPQN
jgi:hypothetical protein